MKRLTSIIAMVLLAASSALAQSPGWEPTGVWPFINKEFKVATVHTGIFKKSKTQVPCNIHVGKNALWYVQDETLMEAVENTVVRVEFPNGDTYIPVGNGSLGRIVDESTVKGKLGRLICVRVVDQHMLDENYLNFQNMTQNVLQGASFLSGVADANAGRKIEEEPLPLRNDFYIQLGSEIFLATTKNILAHINPERKKEYKVYTREAEIISTNESSMMKVWNDFFLNY